MNQINVIQSSPAIKVKSVLIIKIIARIKARVRAFWQWVSPMPTQFKDYVKQQNYEAAFIEHRSMEQMEKRYGPNWISMRGLH